MVVVKAQGRYEARGCWDDRHVVKASGWRWDARGKTWWAAGDADLERLRRNLAPVALEVMDLDTQTDLSIPDSWVGHESCAVDGPMNIPCPPGMSYLPYQLGGIAFARGRDGVLIADEPGLGKTIQAIGILNDEPVKTVLIIVPASLKLNWQREVDKWLNYYLPVHVVWEVKKPLPAQPGVVIVNYDLVAKLRARLDLVEWDVLICDESHLLKNPATKRAQAVVGKDGRNGIEAKRRIFLTGTPIESRPAEIFTSCHALRPDLFSNWLDYAFRYCNAFMTNYGLDTRGSSNAEELQAKLRTSFMIRRLKEDVLKDLPAKVRTRVTLPCDKKLKEKVQAEKAAYERERAILNLLKQQGKDAQEILVAQGKARARMHELRVSTNEGKLPMAIDFLHSAMADGKLVVFAVHHAIIDAIQKEFGAGAVVVDGRVPVTERQARVDRFQSDPECRLFIGQIQAAGVGLTLTAASHVVFVEFDWRPGMLTQAEDRCHRIGQRDCVTVSYLVIEESLDDMMLAVVSKKQETINQTLNVNG